MIDLSRNRAELLAEIEAVESHGAPLSDLTDPRVATGDAQVRVLGHTKKDLFPLLKLALSERFAVVARPQLNGDLLIPLRNALGNAHRHGNAKNPDRAISVGIVPGRNGALVTVTDEGSGFDVAHTFRCFQQQKHYCVNHGTGFRNLHQAKSTVSYENGGRTVLLCFRPTMREQDHAVARPSLEVETSHECGGSRREGAHPSLARSQRLPTSDATRPKRLTDHAPGSDAGEARPNVLDAEWLRAFLSAELPEFATGRAKLESCRVYATDGRAGDDCGNRYVLRLAGPDGQPPETRIFTARLHATEAAAEADFEFATRLHDSKVTKRLAIPRPVARLAGEPRLVLYEFDPWINLWEYLTHRRSVKALRHAAKRAGEALAGLHRSQIACRGSQTDLTEEGFEAMVARTTTALQTLPGGADLVSCFRDSAKQIENAAPSRHPRVLAPIHGAFGWDRIHYGVDGRFYLYRFETCRRSEPGLDLGGFAADLLCFALSNHDGSTYRSCLDAFLNEYNSGAEHSISAEDLRFYIPVSLAERLQRTELRTTASLDQLLAALDTVLLGWGRIATSEVPA
jgi:anti-sigma regulatory factor (Ser/Thr protein kinase)